jgi:hypothetical protein
MRRYACARWVRWLVLGGLQVFLCFGGPGCLEPTNDWLSRSRPGRVVSSEQLTATTISPTLRERLRSDRNVLWCGTFQLAWNECVQLTGGPLHFDRDLPLVAEMNRQEFTQEYVDAANCVIVADFVRNDVYGCIERALKAKANKADRLRYKPNRAYAVRPQDIVAYSYLQADLKFPAPFEELDDRLSFQGVRVTAFGIGPEAKPGHDRLYPQVWVHDYNGREDFVLELASESKGDRLILARMAPGETLLATIEAVEKRLTTPPASREWTQLTGGQREEVRAHLAGPGDVLMIPKIAFDLTHRYDELTGRRLRAVRNDIGKDLQLMEAVQSIRFEMDEEGVRLRSASQMSFGCSAQAPERTRRWMVFDGPFLLMLQREGAPIPYFAAWIANSDLLQK